MLTFFIPSPFINLTLTFPSHIISNIPFHSSPSSPSSPPFMRPFYTRSSITLPSLLGPFLHNSLTLTLCTPSYTRSPIPLPSLLGPFLHPSPLHLPLWALSYTPPPIPYLPFYAPSSPPLPTFPSPILKCDRLTRHQFNWFKQKLVKTLEKVKLSLGEGGGTRRNPGTLPD